MREVFQLIPEGVALVSRSCNGRMSTKRVIDITGFEAAAKYFDGTGCDVYFAPARFSGNRRRAADAQSVQSFWLDLDCGEGKDYPSQAAATKALNDWVQAQSFLKPSLIVSSGYGLHVYWRLSSPVTPDKWKLAAERFKKALSVMGLRADPARTADVASLMRVPGTHNRKNGGEVLVKVLGDTGQAYTLDDFERALPDIPGADSLQAPSKFAVGDDFPPAHVGPIAERCQQMRTVQEAGGAVSEPLWRAALSVVWRCEGGAALIHEWSQGDERYDPDETRAKAEGTKGPATCQHFEDCNSGGCDGCPLKGNITSPIVLGNKRKPALAEDTDHITEAIETINREYAFVMVGSKARIVREVRESGGQYRRTMISEDAFKAIMRNRHLPGGRNAGTAWLAHPRRREYLNGVGIHASGPCPEGVFNLWDGFAIEPQRGPFPLIQRHLLDVVCAGDEAAHEWLLNWLARKVQYPDERAETAVVLRGAKGTGKSLLGRMMEVVFGRHFLRVSQQKHLVGNFNAHLMDPLFVFADEAFWAGDKAGENALKALITEPTVVIEPKGLDSFSMPNKLALMLASNADWVVPATVDERRFLVLDLSDVRRNDAAYFAPLFEEIDTGGISFFLDHLLHRNLKDFDHRRPPRTSALLAQIAQGFDTVERWWCDILAAGELPDEIERGCLPWPEAEPVEVVISALVDHYTRATATRRLRPASRQDFSRKLAGLLGISEMKVVRPKKPAFSTSRPRRYALPSLAEARQAFETATGIGIKDA